MPNVAQFSSDSLFTIRGKLERQVLSDPGLQISIESYCAVIKCSLIWLSVFQLRSENVTTDLIHMADNFLWHHVQGGKLTFCTTMFHVASHINIGLLPNRLQPGAQQHIFIQAFELPSLSANIRGKWPPCERGPYRSETLRGCEQSIHHLPSMKQDLSSDDIMLLSVCSWN